MKHPATAMASAAGQGLSGPLASPARRMQRKDEAILSQLTNGLAEAAGLLRAPWRIAPLSGRVIQDAVRPRLERTHLYSYTTTKRSTGEALRALLQWIGAAQKPDGGIAAYYSLFSGYSASYPEVTGYLIPTLYDAAQAADASERDRYTTAAERATDWLLSLQMKDGSFPAGLEGSTAGSSVFNTGQILQGLVRAYRETRDAHAYASAVSAGDWLASVQNADGSWRGAGAYQENPHTYYSMVAWALAELSEVMRESGRPNIYAQAAQANLHWVLAHFRANGWIDGINLQRHPNYLHFIAYVLQGVLECGRVLGRPDAVSAVEHSAWVLLRRFETQKFLAGAYDDDFRNGRRFQCLTGNAQMACVWLRLYEINGDLRYLNAALKMNELLKERLPLRGGPGAAGGVSGSYPIWGGYQPFRYISWGCKFLADALLAEQRLLREFEVDAHEELLCAS